MLAEGDRELQNEMKVIGRTHHCNLVRLLKYSVDGPHKLLVLIVFYCLMSHNYWEGYVSVICLNLKLQANI